MHKSFRFDPSSIGVFRQENADKPLEGFGKGCQIIGMTLGQFSLIDLIHSTLKKTGRADVYIATWSAGIKDANQVRWLINNNLINRVRLLTDHSYVTRKKNYIASLEDIFGVQNIRCSEMHAKFVIIRNDDYNVTIQTSMNLNANKTCETFTIYENEQVTGFHMDFIEHHFDNLHDGFDASGAVAMECAESYFSKHGQAPEPKKQAKPPSRHWSEL